MSTNACICTKLFGGVDCAHVAIAAVAQMMLGWLWYDGIFKSIFSYYFAADKGVKRAEHVRQRFGHGVCMLFAFFSSIGRVLAVYALVKNLGLTTACQYQEAAFIVAAATVLIFHHDFWAQRPMPLILVNAGHEIGCTLLGATVLHLLVGVKFF